MKTALITGASGGIGIALCKTFVLEGYKVIAQYNENSKPLENLAKELSSSGINGALSIYKCDFSHPDKTISFIEKVILEHGNISVLVNNAGIDLYKLFDLTEESEWDKVINVNLKSAYILSKHVLKGMLTKKWGRIINVSSVWGMVGASMETVYSASKSGLIGLTKALAKEVAPSGITVNCVCPGVIDTKMNACFSKEEMDSVILDIPVGRLGKPQELADLVCFIASEKAGYLTGAVISLDGGFTL